MASNKVIPSYFKVDKLLNDIIECITNMSQEFGCMNIPMDDSCTTFHRFCAKLEQFLYLGLKDKSLFGKKRSYWDYILRGLVSNKGGIHEGLKFVKNNTELKTSVGRGRAFLRFCLVHQCLADTLQQCVLGAGDMSKEWFEEWAPMRNEDAVKQLIAALYDLNPVQFDLSSPSCHDLDQSWPTFNRKEFGSPYNWRAISRSGSISSLSNSLSNIDSFGNPRAMGTMGSLQEGPERNGELAMGDDESIVGAQALREASEEKEVWWMSEDQGVLADGALSTPADISGSWKRGEDGWRKREEEWESKERAWHEERQRLKEEYEAQLELHRSSEEELRVETDMLKARVLELEVVNTMAKWESVGVQATSEDDAEKRKRAELEEKLASVCKENEELKKDLEQMRISSKGDHQKCVTSEFSSKEMDVQVAGIYGPKLQQSSKHEDDLRREYESQIHNIRELRTLYKERMKAAEEQSKKLREELQEKSRRLELSRKRCSELRSHSQELEALLGEQEIVARGLQTRLSASLEEGRALASRLATVNKLFGRLGDTAELDFERLRLLQYSSEKDGDAPDCARSLEKVEGGEEVPELKEIAASLPKVWRLLVELLGEEQKEEEKASEGAKDTSEDCFNSVPTPYGPRLVISVSRTFIKLKDLILEKKSLQNELGKIRDLNGRLESKLKQQERRLATVKVELKRTWGLVARMRAQHEQLHSSEQVLRYELQQKRKLLGELKKELEYCREKWELARLKNSQSEKEWKLLRDEFRARRSTDATVESTEANSPESGFSDGRGEDEEEDGNRDTEYFKSSEEEFAEQEGENVMKPLVGECCAGEGSISIGLNVASGEGACSVDVVDSHDSCELESDQGPKSQGKVETCEEKPLGISEEASSDTSTGEACSPVEPPDLEKGTSSLVEAKVTTGPVVTSQEATCSSKEPPCASSDGACSSKDSEGSSVMKDSVPGSSTPLGAEGGVAPQQAEMSVEERLQARAERLRRLEEQCSLLFRKVTRTTTRSAQLSSRLEELHEQYGDQPSGSRGRSRTESPASIDTETRVRRPTPALIVEHPPTPPPLPSSLPTIRLPTLMHQFTPITESSQSSSSEVLPAEISEGEPSEVQRIPSPEEAVGNQEQEDELGGDEYFAISDSNVDLGNLLPGIQTSESSSSLASNLSEDPSEENESQEMEMEELGLSIEESSTGGGEATESSMTEDTVDSYMAEMSSAIYGLHHGPLFDEGNPLVDEEEYGEGVAEEEEDDMNEEVSAVTSGSIGVASLLLQQLPKRMDILRRERHSLEQRLEEGEAALMRALAGTAAAERRARVLERGLEQAQERLRVLEMEAAVERNERLLEIKAALVDNREGEGNPAESPEANTQNEQSKSLEDEVNNLQQQTLAQIAGLQAAAVVSRTQKEQLDKLTDEVERQEKIVGYMERELANLRQERGELMETLEETRGHLKDATSLLDEKEEENKSLMAEIEKLKKESDESNKENLALFSRLAAAESEVTRLNAEVEQLKDDSEHLRDAVIRLTGEKETLYRANHNLEEMKRLVLEDSRWVADKESEKCTACGVSFSLIIRRHHCRNCGRIFCGACSSHWLALHSAPQSSSLVAGVVESIMSVAGAGKRYRACADCFAAHCADADGDLPGPSQPHDQKTDDYKSPENEAGSSEGAGESGEVAEGGEDDDDEDFSMISEEEVSFSQCTPYVPNPRTLQYWKSCEIQCGVTLSARDLLAATIPDSNEPGNGKGEVIWVRAGSIYSVPLLIDDTHVNILWEFSTDPNSIAFSVLYKTAADIPMSCALIVVPTRRVDSHLKPVRGRLRPKNSGVYILMFDNSFSRFTGKKITYSLKAEVSSGRESVASSSRSSAEPFPDLPLHQEGDVTEGREDREEFAEDDAREEANAEK